MELLISVFVIISICGFIISIFLLFDKYNSYGYRMIKGNNGVIIVSFFLLSISSGFIAFVLNYTNSLIEKSNKDYESIGPLGDIIGGLLNPVVAFVGIIAASLAFYAQYRANAQVQQQFKVQQFESQFYEMLRLHKENVNEMRIIGYGLSNEDSIQYGSDGKETNKTSTKIQTVRYTESRKVFVTMHTELLAIYEFLEYYNLLYNTEIDKKELLNFSYKLFFFGVRSDIPASEIIGKKTINRFKRHLENTRNRHKDTSGQTNVFPRQNATNNISLTDVKLYIKYSPFSGHETRLGHYYRHLYSTVKFVVGKEGSLFNYNEVRGYLKILRAQMSNDEQLMLYYNCVIGFGEDWEVNGFLTKYRMLHNLPVDKVKYATHPRIHFEEFIKSLTKQDGPMFEWGDYD